MKCNHYILALLVASSSWGACVVVDGTIYLPNRTTYNGTLTITWPVPWIAADGTVMPAGPGIITNVQNGVLNICLEANLPATSTNPNNTFYSVTYRPTLTGAVAEVWLVPASGPADISTVRQTSPAPTPQSQVALSQLSVTGASSGQGICFNGTNWAPGSCGNGFSSPMTTLGDMIYENATPGPARLAGNTSSTPQVLTQTGTGSASAAPAWGAVTEAMFSFTNITTGNATTSAHGLVPKGSGNAGDCLIGTMAFAACPSSNAVSSVFGRIGAVVANTGDYTAGQVTNAVDKTNTNSFTAPATLNISGATGTNAVRLPAQAGLVVSATGAVGEDTTATMYHNYTGGVDSLVATIPVSASVTNGHCPQWSVSGSVKTLIDAGAGCSAPGGSTTQLQYNNGGVMGGTAEFTYGSSTITVSSAGKIDISAASSINAFKIPVQSGATATANGGIAYDSTNNMIHAAQSAADAKIPQFTATPANGDCSKWTVSGSNYKLDTEGSPCLGYIATETGSANAIAGTLTGGPTLAAGLTLCVKLAHTLQAGANTFTYNGGSAIGIKSHFNVSNNIATIYAATGTWCGQYDGTEWVDLSQ